MGILRTCLALCVLICHSPHKPGEYWPMSGTLAVQAFFVISGFYMALILTEKYRDKIKLFYSNRILRLIPLYLVVAFLSLVLILIVGRESNFWFIKAQHLNPLSAILLALSNITLIGQDWLMFLGLDYDGWLYFTSNFYQEPVPAYKFLLVPQAWTVGVELAFYAFAPWLIRLRAHWLVAVATGSMILRAVLVFGFHLDKDPWSYRFFPTELVFFVAGILAYRAYRRMKQSGLSFPSWAAWLAVALQIGMYATWYQLSAVWGNSYVIPMLLVAFTLPVVFTATKNNRIDRYIGELSYAIYITHILTINLIRVWSPDYIPFHWVLLANIPMAMLLQYLVERPIAMIRERRAQAPSSASQTNRTSAPAFANTVAPELPLKDVAAANLTTLPDVP